MTVALVRERTPLTESLPTPRIAAHVTREFLGDRLDREYFLALLVDTRHRVTGVNVVSVGSLSGSLVHPREVWKPAILGNAASIVLAHNHPSGDPTPSQEDREVTRRLVETGRILGIDVMDHVILGDGTAYYSFREADAL